MANDERQQQPDTKEPSDERKVELETAYEKQKAITLYKPYKGVKIGTFGELQWIMAQRQWSGEDSLPEGMERANLSSAKMDGDTNLTLSGSPPPPNLGMCAGMAHPSPVLIGRRSHDSAMRTRFKKQKIAKSEPLPIAQQGEPIMDWQRRLPIKA